MMEQQTLTTTRVRPLLTALAVAMIVLIALAMGAQGGAAGPGGWIAAPTPGVDYEGPGAYCAATYGAGSCTANDVRITNISPGIEEVCLGAGDTATAQFKVELQTGATERYDISVYVATDGGSAYNGTSCYHDFLQESSVGGPWDLMSGLGPFKEIEGTKADSCADTYQNDGPIYYTFQAPITFACVDNNPVDGVVDPLGTCTGWHNTARADCYTVQNADIDVGSKCTCEPMAATPPILIYRGFDFGDLPDVYGTYLASNGPRHAVQDYDNNGIPNTQGGIVGAWLGPSVDFIPEGDGMPNAGATGDDANNTDDENGVSQIFPWSVGAAPANGGKLAVYVSTSGGVPCPSCRLGFWIDWNNDGDFGDASEAYVRNVVQGLQTITFDIPSNPTTFYARFRLYDINYYTSTPSPTGQVLNGEVEDYLLRFAPDAVELVSFTATPQAWTRTIRLDWETVSEVDNVGFNLYRADSADGRQIKLNASLIPSQGPGSPFGYRYTFVDRTALAGRAYYYWVEDLSAYGVYTQHGPRKAIIPLRIGVPQPGTP